MLPVPVQGKNEQSIEQILPFWRNISTCPSSMSCQSCQLMWPSCSNLVHIDHQYWRKGRHAGVSQWPLWDNHSLQSFHPCQRSNEELSRPVLPFYPFWLDTLICLNSPELHCWLSSHPHCINMLGFCFRVYVHRSQEAGTDPAKGSMPRACRRGQGLPSDLPQGQSLSAFGCYWL